MLARRSRLPASVLKDTRGFGKRSSQFFIVRSRANRLAHSRFAVVVSAKVDRSAVGRHRLKRRAMGRLRLEAGGRDVVVTILPAARHLPRKQFLREIDQTLLQNK